MITVSVLHQKTLWGIKKLYELKQEVKEQLYEVTKLCEALQQLYKV